MFERTPAYRAQKNAAKNQRKALGANRAETRNLFSRIRAGGISVGRSSGT